MNTEAKRTLPTNETKAMAVRTRTRKKENTEIRNLACKNQSGEKTRAFPFAGQIGSEKFSA
jgi:hypothetical protein